MFDFFTTNPAVKLLKEDKDDAVRMGSARGLGAMGYCLRHSVGSVSGRCSAAYFFDEAGGGGAGEAGGFAAAGARPL